MPPRQVTCNLSCERATIIPADGSCCRLDVHVVQDSRLLVLRCCRPVARRRNDCPSRLSKIRAVVAFRSTLRFISHLAALGPAECSDALQVSTPGEKSISECEIPPQPIRNHIEVGSSSDRPATTWNDLRRMASMYSMQTRQNRAGTIDFYRRLANFRPCAGVLPLASTRFTSCALCACVFLSSRKMHGGPIHLGPIIGPEQRVWVTDGSCSHCNLFMQAIS